MRTKTITDRDKLISDLYINGKSQKEIVEETGASYCVVRYALKKVGAYDSSRRVHNTTPTQEKNEQKKAEAESRMALELLAQGFIYVSGYKNKASECVIHHTACGRSFERVPRYFKGECPLCNQDEIDAKRRSKRMESVEWKRKAEEQREAKQKEAELKEYHRLYDAHICAWCNKIFTIKEYEKREGKSNVNTLTHCSSACIEAETRERLKKSRREHKTERSHIKRAKLHGCEWERGIILRKLIARDGLRCAICGKTCDKNDRSYGNGSGPLYPSIDHIIPLSRGGSHTWGNVQLAHIKCNVEKRDKIPNSTHESGQLSIRAWEPLKPAAVTSHRPYCDK